jgi:hypothetical protein
MKKPLLTASLAAVLATQLGATDCGEIIDDPGFDLWCGDQLCVWKIEAGDARQVPTWHRRDDGVSLIGDPAAISQDTPVNSFDGTCIRFEMLADVEETAEVTLELDIWSDGTVEHVERVPTSHWKKVSFLLAVKAPYDGIRFRLQKRGPGRAVLADIGAQTATGCPGDPIVSTHARIAPEDHGTLDLAGGSP